MRRRMVVPLTLTVLALGLLGVLVWGMYRAGPDAKQQSLDARIESGTPVPAPEAERSLPSLPAGRTGRLRDFRGQVVVLNFWASWCRPCASEAPLLERTHQMLRRRKIGTVLGVTHNDDPASSLSFARKYRLTYPLYRDPANKLADGYGVRVIPETIFIDRQGRIGAVVRGELTEDLTSTALRRVGVTNDDR